MTTVEALSKSGETIRLNVSHDTGYGFAPGDIVHFTKSLRNGKVALIRGTSDGLLWFSVHANVDAAVKEEALRVPVDTASCRAKEELIRQYGWVTDECRNVFVVPASPKN